MLAEGGIVALVPEKKGPKKASRLTDTVITRIVELHSSGLSQQAVGNAVGVSEFSVRRALKIAAEQATTDAAEIAATAGLPEALEPAPVPAQLFELPLVPAPAPRTAERAAAGLLEGAAPVFFPSAHGRHAGLFLAFPALESTGLLACAKDVYGSLPNGFYGLETILIDSVLRALAGAARAEGATRFDPEELGRVLALDRPRK
ncbi:hypothetical protein ART_0550 [Arthrobacter sp. PAMC 25486]|nr:hypothetical protein [Arthrobacter sp. PAMC 25486]AIY00149.1 hypothetical protein ART_0550 [Arthrobacter sp. PAMC 25486]